MDDYTRRMVRVAVAQTCLNVGWSTIHTSPLEILTDLMSDYILGLCKRANNYASLYNQTEPNLDHLSFAFTDLGISIPELEEYVNYFDNNSCSEVPKYPALVESNLNFLKPGSKEVVTRPVHIHEHLPPMYPQLEDQEVVGAAGASPPAVELTEGSAEVGAAVSSPLGGKRRIDAQSPEPYTSRRARVLAEEETRTLREISSVMMTTSGFLSHAREGKLPEVRTLLEVDEIVAPPPPLPPPVEVVVDVQLPPPPEPRHDKKKKRKAPDGGKKLDRESKHVIGTSEDTQVKKLATVKETSKLKVLKPGVAKTLDTFSPPPKPDKKPKIKRPTSPATAAPPSKPKLPKPPIKIEERRSPEPFLDIKLNSEPDKQKLNIFKKITKVKEEEVKVEVHAEPPAFVDVVKEEPRIEESSSIDPPPRVAPLPTFPKTPNNPKLSGENKRKRKEKHRKDKGGGSSPLSAGKTLFNVDSVPKALQITSLEEHLFLGYSGPTLPPNLASNPLIPQNPLMPFAARMSLPPPSIVTPPPVVPPPPDTLSTITAPSPATISLEAKKKEKKDKKNKEKIKKKKDKKEKLKSKDKSERRKLKLQKKQKLEEKIKFKKEKKEKKKDEEKQRGASPSVPKITFKLGPEPQREQSPNPKITFKPLPKKDEPDGGRKQPPEEPANSLPPPIAAPPAKLQKVTVPALKGAKAVPDQFEPPEKPLTVLLPPTVKNEPEINQLWICPACGRPDDGSPMIACDSCDMWYHYVCVGIQEAPESDWFCQGCTNKKLDTSDKKKKHKRKK